MRKSPALPVTDWTSVRRRIRRLGWSTATLRKRHFLTPGWAPVAGRHGPQSPVGNTGPMVVARPPRKGRRSSRSTWWPIRASSTAAWVPATPPPITVTRSDTGRCPSRRSRWAGNLIAASATRSALAVTAARSSPCTQEHPSRMLAASKRRPRSVSPCRRRAAKSAEQPTSTSRPAPSPSSTSSIRRVLPSRPHHVRRRSTSTPRAEMPASRTSKSRLDDIVPAHSQRRARVPRHRVGGQPRRGRAHDHRPHLGQRARCRGRGGDRAGDHRPGRAGAGAGTAAHAAFGVEDDGAEGEDALGYPDRTASGRDGRCGGGPPPAHRGRSRRAPRTAPPGRTSRPGSWRRWDRRRRSVRSRRRARRGAPPRNPSPRG